MVVKIRGGIEGEIIEGLKLARLDIFGKGRAGKAVITCSQGGTDRNPSLNDVDIRKWRDGINSAVNMGVPVIVAAGNHGEQAGRLNVDTAPGIFESSILPLIVVGATDYAGQPLPSSQRGPKVKVWGPGDATCPFGGQDGVFKVTGTSVGMMQS